MGNYVAGKEPPCPLRLPGCAGKISNRGAQACQTCVRTAARRDKVERLQRHTDAVSVSGDGCEITKTTNSRVKTIDELVRVCEIDTTIWEVDRFLCNKWEMGAVPRATGNDKAGWSRESTAPVVTELWQVKAWLKRKVLAIAVRAEIAAMVVEAKRVIPARSARQPKRRETGYSLELSIPDLHAGKLAWPSETGHEAYDAKIAEHLYREACATLLDRTRSYTFDEVVFVVGNDLLHTDNKALTTNSGTQLDADSRFHKTFGIVRRMITRVIDEQLCPVAPVQVYVVPGNHDTMAAWHLGDSLECYFHDRKHVTIRNEPTPRKYHQFHRVMLMFTHGDKGKRTDYPLLMATEQPVMFGATAHREVHTGHRHTSKTEEFHGVRVRTSPALCPPDAWHSENTFVGNLRGAEAYIWHRDQGLVGNAYYTISPAHPTR